MYESTKCCLIWIDALTTNRDPFNNEVFDETGKSETQQPTVHNVYYINKSQILYLYEDFEKSLQSANIAEKTLGATTGFLMHVTRIFFLNLSTAALYPQWSKEEQEKGRETLKQTQDQMKIWADTCPGNFLHKYLLVSAEIARILDNDAQAVRFYEESIEKARENEYFQDAALANELAAKYYLSRKVVSIAKVYMTEAHYWYHRWGATLKAKQLDEKYGYLISTNTVRMPSSQATTCTPPLSFIGERNSYVLDLSSVINASQAISGEVELGRLLKKLMKLVIENAGAQKGFLILEDNGQLKIEAEASVDVITIQSIPVNSLGPDNETHLAVAMIHYVEKTKVPLVLDDATHTGRFTEDSYVSARQPKSVLCAPIMHQNKLTGILYLENNLITGAFTPARLEVLNILSAQAAISIENAKLYHELKETERLRVEIVERKKREEEQMCYQAEIETKNLQLAEINDELQTTLEHLQATQEQLIESEKMGALGQLVAGVAHEVNTPLGVAVTGVSLLTNKTQELEKLYASKEMTRGDLLEYIAAQKNIGQLSLSNLLRASTLIRDFKQVAVDQFVDDLTTFPIRHNLEVIFIGLKHDLKQIQAEVTIECAEDLVVRSYSGILGQIMINLVKNTLMHAYEPGEQGRIQVTVETITSVEGKEDLQIVYTDEGKGIPEKNLPKIFEPFFTTKRSHGG
ncbi:MAG: GAF domain-containing protein, partial [Flavobacteriales bacterium]|nr:GAF domain-containing protein [Flavobacteriales bacterium]